MEGEVIGRRPAKAATTKSLLREFTAQEGIPSTTSRDRLPFGFKGRFDEFSRARIRELTGTVPAKVSYQTWLGRQSAASVLRVDEPAHTPDESQRSALTVVKRGIGDDLRAVDP